jgi:hypothetical protein
VDEIRAMTIRLLALLLIACLAHGQNAIFVKRGRTDGGSGITGTVIPTADFYHSFDNDGGTGVLATADQGANCDLTNTTWVSDDAGGNALSFNGSGTSQAICGSDLDLVNAGAVGACIQAAGYGTSSGFGHIVNKISSSISWALHMNDFSGTGDRFEFRVGSTTPAYDRFLSPIDSMDACVGTTTWCHVAVIFSGCESMGCSATLYLNGVAQTTTPVDVTGTRPNDAAWDVNIGAYPGVGNAFDGIIDNVGFWATNIPTPTELAAEAALCTARNP